MEDDISIISKLNLFRLTIYSMKHVLTQTMSQLRVSLHNYRRTGMKKMSNGNKYYERGTHRQLWPVLCVCLSNQHKCDAWAWNNTTNGLWFGQWWTNEFRFRFLDFLRLAVVSAIGVIVLLLAMSSIRGLCIHSVLSNCRQFIVRIQQIRRPDSSPRKLTLFEKCQNWRNWPERAHCCERDNGRDAFMALPSSHCARATMLST